MPKNEQTIHPSSSVKFVDGPTRDTPSTVKTDDGRSFAVHYAAGSPGFIVIPAGG